MNEEERTKIGEENINLIYKFLTDYHLNYKRDEIIDILYIGYTIALNIYDKTMGKFSTIAYRCMQREYYHYCEYKKQQKRHKDIKIISLNKIALSDINEIHELIDLIPDKRIDIENDVINKLLVEEFVNNIAIKLLSKTEYLVFRHYFIEDMKLVEIAKKYNKNYEFISYCKLKVEKKIKKYFESEVN